VNRDTRLIALALFLWGFGDGLYFYIQPLYFEQLGANSVQIGGLLSTVSLVSTLTYLPAGVLSDRVPRKWMMCGGWILGSVGMLLVALACTWQGLVPGLMIYAFSAYCLPIINAYAVSAAEEQSLERTLTTIFAGFAAGGVISPTVGGWLAQATTMQTVYFTATGCFVLSTLVVMWASPQPVPPRVEQSRPWRALLNLRFLRFAVLIGIVFVALAMGFPLAPNFLARVRDWDVARIGALGSFQALGTALLNPLLGRLGNGRRLGGLAVGQILVWCWALSLLLTGAFPILALAYLLRGAYAGCLALTRARATTLGTKAEQGILLGATETIMSVGALVIAPYIAGWLYAIDPRYPLVVSLVLIPAAALLSIFKLPRT
jgi:MFS family permease